MQHDSNSNRNQQQIDMGVNDNLQHLEALQREYALLEKSIADKEMIIQLLQKQG